MQYLPIDKNKFQNELNKRNLKMTELSLESGHEISYVSHLIKNGKLSKPIVTLLEKIYNMPYALYGNTAPEIREPEPEKEPFSYDELFEVIYQATKKAFTEALKG